MKKVKINLIILFGLGIGLSSCEKMLEPSVDNRLTEEQVLENPAFAEGLLLNAYDALPNAYSFDEVATDDAVTNSKSSSFTRMATGEWNASYNPLSVWSSAYKQIYYINLFLEKYRSVQWSWEYEQENEYYLKRMSGEAHILRAWYEFELLKNHAGISDDGDLLGFPIVTNTLTVDDDLFLPRDSYEDCVQQILNDCDSAILNLPAVYADNGDSHYEAVLGESYSNRFAGLAAYALKSRVSLYAASPAFTEHKAASEVDAGWELAANAVGQMLRDSGGVSMMSATGHLFYLPTTLPSLSFDKDIILRQDYDQNNDIESDNYPPSLFGSGEINPSQSLVDAFPMANGYPISDALSLYDPSDPYLNRDPRLSEYIVYDGNTLRGDKVINTYIDGTIDAPNATTESTRTGYYLKKFMHPNVNVESAFSSEAIHFYTMFRFTEVFLNYAEAANEAWGPDGDPQGYGFTARDVIAAIRNRAGISQPDNYLNSLSTIADMRELIQTERRIELSFEGFRFWDQRRWKLSIDDDVKGAFITLDGTYSYGYDYVESRNYSPHMYYGPIPYNETLIYDLKQNAGW